MNITDWFELLSAILAAVTSFFVGHKMGSNKP